MGGVVHEISANSVVNLFLVRAGSAYLRWLLLNTIGSSSSPKVRGVLLTTMFGLDDVDDDAVVVDVVDVEVDDVDVLVVVVELCAAANTGRLDGRAQGR